MVCELINVFCIGGCSFAKGDKFLHDKLYEECPNYQKIIKQSNKIVLEYNTAHPGFAFLKRAQLEEKKLKLEKMGFEVEIKGKFKGYLSHIEWVPVSTMTEDGYMMGMNMAKIVDTKMSEKTITCPACKQAEIKFSYRKCEKCGTETGSKDFMIAYNETHEVEAPPVIEIPVPEPILAPIEPEEIQYVIEKPKEITMEELEKELEEEVEADPELFPDEVYASGLDLSGLEGE